MASTAKELQIREDWKDYYFFLEALRRTGVCNMWGASVYLKEAFPISDEDSRVILANWMNNYEKLKDKYNWN